MGWFNRNNCRYDARPVFVESLEGRRLLSASLTTLASFGGVPLGGPMIDPAGNLYGTTSAGGSHNAGTIFRLTAGTNARWTLASFDFSTVGATPNGKLLRDSAGNLYGTTESGGAYSDGTLFKLVSGSNRLIRLASFNTATTGTQPAGNLTSDSKGDLFGTTGAGGPQGDGTVFELPVGSSQLKVLATFNQFSGSPWGGLVADAAGNLFGTTSGGGSTDTGTIFEISATTHKLTTRASLGWDTAFPVGGLTIDAEGDLYGAFGFSDLESNGIFELSAGASTATVIASFIGPNGLLPAADLLIDAEGNLYGTTATGGAFNYGTAFEISSGSHKLQTLVSFDGADGACPGTGLVVDADGNLFGTAESLGGHTGSVFKISGSGFVI